MAKPIYVLYIFDGRTEAWFQLSKEEQNAINAKVDEINKNAGTEWVIACNARWADDGKLAWSVAKYPDLETYQKKTAEMEKLGWFRYMKANSILGTKMGE